ncbi:MAG: hypothetical protein SFW35_09595 [Chitinophagales bacterium]|nr:hypothetical protein [Chitinophagales bacterium]
MRYKLLIGAIGLLSLIGCKPKQPDYSAEILKQAEEVRQGFITGDFKLVLKHIYPSQITEAGGEAMMIERWTSAQTAMKQNGYNLIDIKLGKPTKVVHAGKELHCLVQENIIMEKGGQLLDTESYLLGISQDNGKLWYFIDTYPLSMPTIKQILPHYNDSLVIPPKKETQVSPRK